MNGLIHKFFMNGLYIVIDVNSGMVHNVDKLAYDILDFYKDFDLNEIILKLNREYAESDITETYGEIKELEENKLLFVEDVYENLISSRVERKPVVKALCLHIAHDCNLRCKYCFAEEGEYHGKRSLMSAEVGKAALDFLIKESGARVNLEVDFFGGEPLMNFNVVKEIVEYGRELEKSHNKKFRFTMTTNGLLLDEDKLQYINKHMHNLVLSLDGRKSVNDNMRKLIGGASSYDVIVPKFQKAAESRNQTDYYLRGTFTRENLDFCEDVKHMAELGFKQISVEPVVADESAGYAIQSEDVENICAEYEKLARYMLEIKNTDKDFNFFHFMIDLSGGPCVWKRMTGCGAGTEYLAVTPEGKLFPCHQFVGLDGFEMGSVFHGVENAELGKKFDACNVYSKDDCKKCWAKFYCSGGCAANSWNQNGDLSKPYEIGCELQRKRAECAIMLKVHESLKEESVV